MISGRRAAGGGRATIPPAARRPLPANSVRTLL